MRIQGGYACDDCGTVLVLDTELNARGAVDWQHQRGHFCIMCTFGISDYQTDTSEVQEVA